MDRRKTDKSVSEYILCARNCNIKREEQIEKQKEVGGEEGRENENERINRRVNVNNFKVE